MGVLAVFGLYTGLSGEDDRDSVALIEASGWRAAALGLSISMDELAIGFTLGVRACRCCS